MKSPPPEDLLDLDQLFFAAQFGAQHTGAAVAIAVRTQGIGAGATPVRTRAHVARIWSVLQVGIDVLVYRRWLTRRKWLSKASWSPTPAARINGPSTSLPRTRVSEVGSQQVSRDTTAVSKPRARSRKTWFTEQVASATWTRLEPARQPHLQPSQGGACVPVFKTAPLQAHRHGGIEAPCRR